MLAGLLGIGGGIIMVPAMVGLLHIDQHRAHGTSLAVIVPISIMGVTMYAARGDINWALTAAIGSSSVIGAVIGARSMMNLSSRRLRQIFGVYMIAVGVVLFLR